MEENKLTFIVCIRVIDLDEPRIVSWKDTCSQCRKQVWRADAVSVDKVLCVQCATDLMRKEKDITIMPPTKEQLQIINNSLTRVKN
jgi:Zn ribbon nucleic-acid-binding protein